MFVKLSIVYNILFKIKEYIPDILNIIISFRCPTIEPKIAKVLSMATDSKAEVIHLD